MNILSIKICIFIGFHFFIMASFAQNPNDFCGGTAMEQLPNSSGFRDIVRLNNNTYVAIGIKRNIPTKDELYFVNFDLCKDTLWTKFYGNQHSLYTGHYIINVDDSSFAIVCSYMPDYTINPYYEYLLLKLNYQGDTLWSKAYSLGIYNDGPACILLTQDGGFIIGGFSDNFPDNSAYSQAWILKTDSVGNIEWSKTYGFDNASEIIRAIVQNEDGTYSITAQRTQSGTSSLWVFKLDSQGNVLWNRILGNGYWTVGIAMLPAQDGYIIAGLEQPYIWNVGNAFVLKIDTTGTQQWIKYYGDGSMDEFSNMIKLSDGNLIAIGSNRFSSSGSYHSDAWLMKLNAEGDSIWSRTYAYNGMIPISDYVWGISQTEAGGFMIAGFTSVLNADSTSATQSAWIVRTDSLGNACYLPAGCEWAVGIAQTPHHVEENAVRVYPNPAQNLLHFTLTNSLTPPSGGWGVTLFTPAGQQVLHSSASLVGTPATAAGSSVGILTTASHSIDVGHLPVGVYFYVVTAGGVVGGDSNNGGGTVVARGKVAVVR